jgi:hypothetical protein
MEPESLDSDCNISGLEAISDSDENFIDGGCDSDGNETDWFSEIGKRAGSNQKTEELSGIDWSECSLLVNIDLDSVSIAEPDETATQVGVDNKDLPCVKIYDSSCLKHLMPYRDALKNIIEIFSKSFWAANKQNMMAVGMDEMTMNIPDGSDVLQLRLTKVLYSPKVDYTLVSVGQLNDKGWWCMHY